MNITVSSDSLAHLQSQSFLLLHSTFVVRLINAVQQWVGAEAYMAIVRSLQCWLLISLLTHSSLFLALIAKNSIYLEIIHCLVRAFDCSIDAEVRIKV